MFYRDVSNSKPLAVLFVVSDLASYVLGVVLNNVFHVGVWNPNLRTFPFPNSSYFRPEPKIYIPFHTSKISTQL